MSRSNLYPYDTFETWEYTRSIILLNNTNNNEIVNNNESFLKSCALSYIRRLRFNDNQLRQTDNNDNDDDSGGDAVGAIIRNNNTNDDDDDVVYSYDHRLFEGLAEEFNNDAEILLETHKIVDDDEFCVNYASPELLDDLDFMLKVIDVVDPFTAVEYGSVRLRDESLFILKLVERGGNDDGDGFFEYASPRLKNDKNVVLDALKLDPTSFDYASNNLKANREFMIEAITIHDWMLLEDADPTLRDDKVLVSHAVQDSPFAFRHASTRLQDDTEFVLQLHDLYGQDGHIIKYASTRIKNDFHLGLLAVRKHGKALGFLSSELQKNIDIVVESELNILELPSITNLLRCRDDHNDHNNNNNNNNKDQTATTTTPLSLFSHFLGRAASNQNPHPLIIYYLLKNKLDLIPPPSCKLTTTTNDDDVVNPPPPLPLPPTNVDVSSSNKTDYDGGGKKKRKRICLDRITMMKTKKASLSSSLCHNNNTNRYHHRDVSMTTATFTQPIIQGNGKNRNRGYVFTDDEVDALIGGIYKYGYGNWALILSSVKILKRRFNVYEIKDKSNELREKGEIDFNNNPYWPKPATKRSSRNTNSSSSNSSSSASAAVAVAAETKTSSNHDCRHPSAIASASASASAAASKRTDAHSTMRQNGIMKDDSFSDDEIAAIIHGTKYYGFGNWNLIRMMEKRISRISVNDIKAKAYQLKDEGHIVHRNNNKKKNR